LNISEKTAELELEVAESSLLLGTNSGCKIQNDGRVKRVVLPPFSGMIAE
jgi:hypothetical protein